MSARSAEGTRRCGRATSGAWAAALLAMVVLSSCGLSQDARPRPISDRAITDLVSPAPGATSPVPNGAGIEASLYFVRSDRLEQVAVPVNGGLTADRVLALLLNGPPRDATPADLTTSIPPGTALGRTELKDGTLRIDLGGDIKSIGGSAAKTAYAQLVFTALDLPGVRRVRFAIEGDDIDALTDDGNLGVITAKNYRKPLRPGQ